MLKVHNQPSLAKRTGLVLFCLLCSVILSAMPLDAVEIEGFGSLIANGGYALQLADEVVLSGNSDTSYIPASTIKVLTSLMALEILGPEYRFVTRFFIDPDKMLYIQGEGDPFLTSEMVTRMAVQLKNSGITEVETIVLDDSAFTLETPPPGSTGTSNPYDAHNSALAVNFNALPFKVTADSRVLAAEKQTPLLPMMEDLGRNYPAGNYRVNVSGFPSGKNHSNILRYSGELITTLFTLQGIKINNGFKKGTTPREARSILVYESEKDVAELVRLCLFFSNNFIANQLYLSCGARIHGFPATWEKAGRAAREYITLQLQLQPEEIHMEDGSGLSTDNRISPAAMLTVLNRFMPYATLMKRQEDTYLKSGTLTGVYCYVGYFGTVGNFSPFVFFLNQMHNNRELLLHLLRKEYLDTFF
ncbi:D-alanyl-D-alanine carboxypeptidase/D-alanyl-D-alanine-endopeptidase [Desulfopila inferna]|uniref:D-alanyl-D-alanine carboxypeptidase/D-alanyl-D-alanine-endopeptidase n=1 Tax=Desulfopila inferna TaxID=468528 RepID=UPI001966C61E|nr:D-alanyl-D-alanine carboxypeptidase [Desulfopila inferna]MBM9604321.1 D-alanyl-D-alanine carboxypeptidase [Desulfopila inferna]